MRLKCQNLGSAGSRGLATNFLNLELVVSVTWKVKSRLAVK